MSDVLNQKTIKARSADLMTIPQIQAAKKIVKSKLESNRNDPVISKKLQDVLYDYEKKEKAINSFYSRCMKHKDPKVIGLVQGKRNLLRFVDVYRVSKNGKISNISVVNRADKADYGVGAFLRDIKADQLAVGVGVATIGAGLASMQFGNASLFEIIKEALAQVFKSNPVAFSLITGGVALIAGTMVASNISKKIKKIKQHMAKSAEVQNEIFDEMNNEPRLDPFDLNNGRFEQSKEQIVQSLFNSPELLHVYEHALKNPKQHGLNAFQRLNLMSAMKEAYSRIDDFKREMRGEPTKAQIAEMQRQKEQDAEIAKRARDSISSVKSSIDKISKESSTQQIESIGNTIKEIETTISSIKDAQIKESLLSELKPIKTEFETKSKPILSEKQAETQAVATEIENDIAAINGRISGIENGTDASSFEQIERDISDIEKKVDGIDSDSTKTKLKSSIKKLKTALIEKKNGFTTTKVIENDGSETHTEPNQDPQTEPKSEPKKKSKTKTESAISEENQKAILALNQIKEDRDKLIEIINDMDESNFNSPEIGLEVNGLRRAANNIEIEEIRAEAIKIAGEVESEYTKSFNKIRDAVEMKESEKSEVDKIFEEMVSIGWRIKGEKTNGAMTYEECLISIRKEIAEIKPRIDAISEIDDKAFLIKTYINIEKEHRDMSREIHIISVINEVIKNCNSMTSANHMILGKKLESIESDIYSLKNSGLVKRYEFAERKYMTKRAQIKGHTSTKEFDNINNKFNKLRVLIGNLNNKTLAADSANIQNAIKELESLIEKLPAEKAHFREKLETARDEFVKAKENASIFEAQKNKDLSLSNSMTKYERTFLQLNESNYGYAIKSLEAQEYTIELMFAEIEKNASDTSNHYRVMFDSFKQGYRAKRESVERKINENNRRIILDIEEISKETAKVIDSMNEYNYASSSRLIRYNIEKMGSKIENLKNIIDHSGFESGLSEEMLSKLNELQDRATIKSNEYRLEAKKHEDRNNEIKAIKGEIAEILSVIEDKNVSLFDNHGIIQHMAKLKDIVEKIGDDGLTAEFLAVENIYNEKKAKEESERSVANQEINEITTDFENYRKYLEDFKNIHSFDDIKKGKNTQQFLTGELSNIKRKIEKLPKDSYHRQHFEQVMQKEEAHLGNRITLFELVESVNKKIDTLGVQIAAVSKDVTKMDGKELIDKFSLAKNTLYSIKPLMASINHPKYKAALQEKVTSVKNNLANRKAKQKFN